MAIVIAPPSVPASSDAWRQTLAQRWATEIALPVTAAEWAARLLVVWAVALFAVVLVWPLRLAARFWRWCWTEPERLVCTAVFGGPIALLMRVLPSVSWPSSYAEALGGLRLAGLVLGVAFLALTIGGAQDGIGRSGSARPLVASPYGVRNARWVSALHEAGHSVVGRALGRRTCSWLTSNSTGWTKVSPGSNPIKEAAIDHAGWIAAGTQWGASIDIANANGYTHGSDRAKAEALARRLVRERAGEVKRVARKLYDAPNGTVIR